MSGTSAEIVGRDAELSRLTRALDAAAAGRGSALILHGLAGTGRSTLMGWTEVEAAARGCTVLSTSGVEAERWFPFAALHLLLQPIGGEVAPPDAAADVHRVALAVFELLTEAAGRAPVVVLIDDLQWVDVESRAVLAFVARRARGHALLVVGAARTGDPHHYDSFGAVGLRLVPLGPDAAAALLDRRAAGLPSGLRDLVLAEAAGNPLALSELPEALTPALDDGDQLPLTPRLETAFSAHPHTCSRECRLFLLALAAEPDASLHVLLEVTAALAGAEVTPEVVQEALGTDLIVLTGRRPAFRHPLSRPAVYRRAGVTEQLRVHRALAVALHDDPRRSMPHEAAATIGPDDPLSVRLEAVADEALADGDVTTALTALRRAAPLAADRGRGTGLLIRAVELAEQLSERDHARRLLGRADLRAAGPVDRGRLLVVSDAAAVDLSEVPQRIGDMVAAAARAHDAGAVDVAENLLWRAAMRCSTQNPPGEVRRQVTAELDRWRTGPENTITLAVPAHADPFGRGTAVLPLLAAGPGAPADGRALHHLGSTALALGEDTLCVRYFGRAAARWREEGRLGLLARSLMAAWPRVYLGQLAVAADEAAEGRELALRSGESNIWLGLTGVAALVAAIRGDTETAALLLRELRTEQDIATLPLAAGLEGQATGMLSLFDGRASEAYEALSSQFPTGSPYPMSKWRIVPDLADAAVAAGAEAEARRLLADLPELARRLPSEQMVVADLYAAAVLADEGEAAHRYTEALRALPSTAELARARLHLHRGRWLHRQRRYLDAREPLRAARAAFDRMGARPWAEAADRQLRATGETHGTPFAVGAVLSAREREIATLAGRGLSNREIGQRLRLSPRTVASYLYRLYPRLGISRRQQLAEQLEKNPEAT
ncbi:AAA family ATPase [Paractinoplanes atraurantiacus]|uniref:Regulatory protein, luxR family n=1 Tax=Paractinoplanes atraurantiacus TaxID=1036182 RepID=A0A285J006_9ACTN|nr:LuxR family transcriptional regulator [Actinoplanes atraurantiacus]SNY53635.1 regulatory protein, luxR family [Actinoplanes atraurantiacus]